MERVKKKQGAIVITAVAVIIGMVAAAQLSMAGSANPGGLISISKLQVYDDQLKEVQARKEESQTKLNDLEAQIRQIEQDSADADYKLKGIMTEQDKYKLAAGAVDVEGPGLEITIKDPDNAEQFEEEEVAAITSDYDILLSTINKLKEAGAEAVSINGQRILSRTEIIPVERHLNINSVPTAPPYVIQAIGDADRMEAVVNIKYGVAYTLRQSGFKVEIKKQDKITIHRYSGSLRFRYANPVEEEQ